jgi:hypothetical protein
MLGVYLPILLLVIVAIGFGLLKKLAGAGMVHVDDSFAKGLGRRRWNEASWLAYWAQPCQ